MTKSIFEDLLVDSSRLIADMVADQVGTNHDKLTELYDLAIHRERQLAMRAARALDLADEARPGLAAFLIPRIRQELPSIQHQSVQRCLLRTINRYPLPEDDEELGRFYAWCMELVADPKIPIALRYYGMEFVYRVCLDLPDLRFELFPLFEDVILEDGKGLKGRAIFLIKQLEKKFGREH